MMHDHATAEQGRRSEEPQAASERHTSEADTAGHFWFLASVAASIRGPRTAAPAVSEIVVTKDLDIASTGLF
jgi:hypothetical protein